VNVLSIIGLSLLLAVQLRAAQELKPTEIYQRILPSLVSLEVENGAGEKFVGAGFLALTNDVAVTSWHVVADARKVFAKFSDGKVVEVPGFLDRNEKSDLVLLRLSSESRPRTQSNPASPPIGTRVYALGSPKGYDFSITDGLVSQTHEVSGVQELQISCPISGGNSGGPLVNEMGEVIGIVSWTKSDAQSLSFAIPVALALELNPNHKVQTWDELNDSKKGTLAVRTTQKESSAYSVSK